MGCRALDSEYYGSRGRFFFVYPDEKEGGACRKMFDGTPEMVFTPSIINSVSVKNVGAKLQILGTGLEDAEITVNGQDVTRDGAKFFLNLEANNQNSAVMMAVDVVGVQYDPAATPTTGGNKAGNVAGADIIAEFKGEVFIPQSNEALSYDNGGRLFSDSGQRYYWNAKDQLIKVESRIANSSGKLMGEKHFYDHAGRRIRTEVYENGDVLPVSVHQFYYDQTLLNGSPAPFGVMVGEKITENGNTTDYEFVWGLDLNGKYQGLGGVGGLLCIIEKGRDGSPNRPFFPLMDAKGTVCSLVDASTGKETVLPAKDPYG
ncbi:MAG: hypothetical protein WAX69_07860, partial [Victivallales bacterium]